MIHYFNLYPNLSPGKLDVFYIIAQGYTESINNNFSKQQFFKTKFLSSEPLSKDITNMKYNSNGDYGPRIVIQPKVYMYT
jgi:hypothetical protein